MVGKIKENSNRNNYGCYATSAIRAERNAEYGKAAELWASALKYARSSMGRDWATIRIAFCTNAEYRNWGLPAPGVKRERRGV